MKFDDELDVYLRARFTLILLVTTEEERALQTIKTVCEQTQRPCLTWDIAEGFQWLSGSGPTLVAKDPVTALEQIDKTDNSALYVLKDFHDAWSNPQIKRKLRSVAQRLKFSKKSILITSPSSKIPDELKDESVIVEFPSPTTVELDDVLRKLTQTPGVKVNLTTLGREKLVQAALGLTSSQAQRVFAKAIVRDGMLDDRDIDLVTEEKKQIIRESEALEFYAVTETPDDVGGLGVLKEWLRLRERAFTQEARNYGLPAPKGIALIGIPGTGKSLTAKMIGGLWRLPLLRLDVGALFGSLVGESEERARRALKLAETVAPCVPGDTLITLADGSESTIESLYEKSPESLQVMGMSNNFELQPVQVYGISCRQASDLYEIKLSHGELSATGNHLHPVLHNGQIEWKTSDSLHVGDYLTIPKKIPTSQEYPALIDFLPENTRLYIDNVLSVTQPEFQTRTRKYAAHARAASYVKVFELALPAEKLPAKDITQYAIGHGGTADSIFQTIPERLNDDIGYLLGLLSSDGYLSHSRISLINTNITLHGLFSNIIQAQFGLIPKMYLMDQPDKNIALQGITESSVFKNCYSSYVDNRLLNLILRNIKQRILSLPTPFLQAWVRGHFDGDGYISNRENVIKVIITAKNRETNRLVRSILHRVGFPTTNQKAKNIEITGQENVNRFIKEIGASHPEKMARMEYYSLEKINEPKDRTDVVPIGDCLRQARLKIGMESHQFKNTGRALISNYERGLIHPNRNRLRKIALEMEAWAETHGKDPSPIAQIKHLVDGQVQWSRVNSIQKVEKQDLVYDLICESPHTFIANNIITHNCIVWIDEIEKALAHGGSDSGTSTRVFGTILTWMQEKTAPCFVVATANDITSLPPELLRKGRFDEIFFLDLPTLEERQEIFGVHLRKRARLPQDFDVRLLAAKSEGYVGAEIEQAIIDAMYIGFNAKREFNTADIASAIEKQVPLSVSQRETITSLRNWLREGRAQSASFSEFTEAEQQFVQLQIRTVK